MAAAASNPQVQNDAIRQAILQNAIPVLQNVRSGSMTYAAGSPTVANIQASNVGLIRRFFLEVSGTLNCAAAHTLTATQGGLANLLSNVSFTDQNNRLRINTTGWHLHLAASEKRRRPFGVAVKAAGMNDTTGLGANFPVQTGPATVSGGTAQNFTFIWEIPVVTSNTDLTGAIYANQTTSNNQLAITLNPNFFIYNTDTYNAGFSTDAALATTLPTLTNLTWNLYQDFLDQLPTSGGFAALPPLDISYAVCLQMINPGPMVAGVDNLYALPAFNIYTNMMLFWDNYGLSAGAVGSDIQYIKVQVSNTYILTQVDPLINAVISRNIIGCDFPAGIGATFSGAVYNLDFRHKPLSVNQLSSTNIIFRPTNVQSASALNIGQEYLWYANAAAS